MNELKKIFDLFILYLYENFDFNSSWKYLLTFWQHFHL